MTSYCFGWVSCPSVLTRAAKNNGWKGHTGTDSSYWTCAIFFVVVVRCWLFTKISGLGNTLASHLTWISYSCSSCSLGRCTKINSHHVWSPPCSLPDLIRYSNFHMQTACISELSRFFFPSTMCFIFFYLLSLTELMRRWVPEGRDWWNSRCL